MTPLDVERATIAAWPAGETEQHSGWFFLAASGVTGRVNAVWPLTWQGGDVDAAIDDAERWYAARGMPPRFKLTGDAYAPADLPERLAQRRYAPTVHTLVMTRTLSRVALTGSVDLSPRMTPLFEQALRDSTPNADELDERRAIALRAPKPTAFAVRADAGAPLAIGMSAIAGSLAGIFLMRTVPAARRQGHARHILRALLAWAAAQGAANAFLQVEADNAPAVKLYESEGFSALTSYRFWRKAS